jgi:hypothetical protein
VKRLVVEELESVWETLQSAESGEAAEEAAVQWSRKAARALLEAGLQARVDAVQTAQATACACGGRTQLHSRRPRLVVTLLGPVQIERQYRRCDACGARSFPAEAWLGWEHGFSGRVEEAVAWSVAALPYRPAVEGLRRFAGIDLSLSAAQAIVARWGKARTEPAANAEPVAGRLAVEIDGTMAHVDGAWREVKLAGLLRVRRGKAEAVSYVADWLRAEEFQTVLWQEAQVRGVERARAAAVLGDGAAWIWETANTLFPEATEILDWYHASEHLWQAGRVIGGEGTAQTRTLVRRWHKSLRRGDSAALEQELRTRTRRQADPEEVLRKTADYLGRHHARLDYPHFRRAGWPIGSGIAEGGCKHVIGLRFKRKSTRWKSPGFRSVLHLRLDVLNDRWQQRCEGLSKAA